MSTMSENKADECCPRFNPEPWDGKTLTWENRRFVKDRVTSFLHIPLNFGAVMKRNVARSRRPTHVPRRWSCLQTRIPFGAPMCISK